VTRTIAAKDAAMRKILFHRTLTDGLPVAPFRGAKGDNNHVIVAFICGNFLARLRALCVFA
jgi:hypothetical protein